MSFISCHFSWNLTSKSGGHPGAFTKLPVRKSLVATSLQSTILHVPMICDVPILAMATFSRIEHLVDLNSIFFLPVTSWLAHGSLTSSARHAPLHCCKMSTLDWHLVENWIPAKLREKSDHYQQAMRSLPQIFWKWCAPNNSANISTARDERHTTIDGSTRMVGKRSVITHLS